MFLIIIFTFIVAYLFGSVYFRGRKLPPGPFAFPLFGNMPQFAYAMANGQTIVSTMRKWQEKYGPVFTMWMGPYPTVNICDWSIAQDAMVKKGHAFADRWVPYLFKQTRRGLGVVFTNGYHWVEQRRFALHTLRNFGLGRNLMEDRIMLEVDCRSDYLNDKIMKNGGKYELNPEKFFNLVVGNIINRILFTERFTEEREKVFFHLKGEIDRLVGSSTVVDMMIPEKAMGIPFLKRRNDLKMKPFFELIDFIKSQIDQRLAEIAAGTHKPTGDGDDFVDAFLVQMEKDQGNKEKSSFHLESLQMTLLDLWLAGQETTATVLYWSLNYLLLNPDVDDIHEPVLVKAQKELDDLTGGNRSLSLSDKPQTPYLNAVITESLRHASILAINLWRQTDSDTVVGDFVIPKGTNCTAQLSLIMSDESTFKNPAKFDPSRYLGDNRLDPHVVSFGMGKRACLGESLARAELYLILGNFLLRYKVAPTADSRLGMEAQSEKGGIRKCHNYRITVENR